MYLLAPRQVGKVLFKAPRKFFKDALNQSNFSEEIFISALEEYNISSFLKPTTEICFQSELHDLKYTKREQFTYTPKLLNRLKKIESLSKASFNDNVEEIKKQFTEICIAFRRIKIKSELKLETREEAENFTTLENLENFAKLKEDVFLKILNESFEIEEYLSTSTSLYIPAERNFINIIKSSSLNLQLNNVPIPKNILLFGAELEKSKVTDVDLSFLKEGLKYRNINKEDRIFFNQNESIKLSEAASGIQSVLPILISLTEKNQASKYEHRSFVIEEPELNLFPQAQYGLIIDLEFNRVEPFGEDSGTIHTYTTHSPYILSTFNNLLAAHLVIEELTKELYHTQAKIPFREYEIASRKLTRKVHDIVKVDIDPDKFNAYQIYEGKAQSIFNRNTGLLDQNFIDESSDKISDGFDALMELLNDKAGNSK